MSIYFNNTLEYFHLVTKGQYYCHNKTIIHPNKAYITRPRIILSALNFNIMSTILQIANADRHLSTLMKGIKSTDIEEILNDIGPFTLFAPVNLAFSNLGNLSWDDLLRPGNKSKLADLLSYHILKGKKLFGDFSNGQILTMVNGKDVTVLIKDDAVFINGAKILSRDRQGNNGVIHSVDAVNVPANPLYKV